MNLLTIAQASEITGWSARMLRYVERLGLVEPERSAAGYRLYGPGQLQRLRTLRELLDDFELGLSDLGFAARLRTDAVLRRAVDGWLSTQPQRPPDIDPGDWLRWEQDKHQRLLGTPTVPSPVPLKETA